MPRKKHSAVDNLVHNGRRMKINGITEAAYIDRYGDSNDYPLCYGLGGQIIWLSDSLSVMRDLQEIQPSDVLRAKIASIRIELALWYSYIRLGISPK